MYRNPNYHKSYYERNKDKFNLKEYQKEWYELNRPHIKAYQKVYQKKYYQANKEKKKIYQKARYDGIQLERQKYTKVKTDRKPIILRKPRKYKEIITPTANIVNTNITISFD